MDVGDWGHGAGRNCLEDWGVELFSKSVCYISVMGGGFGGTSDRLIGRGFGMFTIEEFDYA